jgi:polar amino acid transport system permease protein
MRSLLAPSPALIDPPDLLLLESADALAVDLAACFLAEESARGGAAAARYLESDPREYETWLGGALLGVRGPDGSPAAGGGFRRYDTTTAELAQLWTRPDLRRTGLARRVLGQLEPLARRAGYGRLYAVAEPGHEALRRTLTACGYEPLGPAGLEYLGFVKAL